jgi:hypothetical protein
VNEVVLPTDGGCMRPWIWPNGKLHVERCIMAELRPGDIAVWFDGTNFISHRVVELDAGVLTTRADSKTTTDAPVQPSQLLGRAVRFTKGPISYQLDGPLVAFIWRTTSKPWNRLLAAARWARACLRQQP